eukprot:m51a1_g3763 hypothetical protein (1253) ;mRNA; r:116784-120596
MDAVSSPEPSSEDLANRRPRWTRTNREVRRAERRAELEKKRSGTAASAAPAAAPQPQPQQSEPVSAAPAPAAAQAPKTPRTPQRKQQGEGGRTPATAAAAGRSTGRRAAKTPRVAKARPARPIGPEPEFLAEESVRRAEGEAARRALERRQLDEEEAEEKEEEAEQQQHERQRQRVTKKRAPPGPVPDFLQEGAIRRADEQARRRALEWGDQEDSGGEDDGDGAEQGTQESPRPSTEAAGQMQAPDEGAEQQDHGQLGLEPEVAELHQAEPLQAMSPERDTAGFALAAHDEGWRQSEGEGTPAVGEQGAAGEEQQHVQEPPAHLMADRTAVQGEWVPSEEALAEMELEQTQGAQEQPQMLAPTALSPIRASPRKSADYMEYRDAEAQPAEEQEHVDHAPASASAATESDHIAVTPRRTPGRTPRRTPQETPSRRRTAALHVSMADLEDSGSETHAPTAVTSATPAKPAASPSPRTSPVANRSPSRFRAVAATESTVEQASPRGEGAVTAEESSAPMQLDAPPQQPDDHQAHAASSGSGAVTPEAPRDDAKSEEVVEPLWLPERKTPKTPRKTPAKTPGRSGGLTPSARARLRTNWGDEYRMRKAGQYVRTATVRTTAVETPAFLRFRERPLTVEQDEGSSSSEESVSEEPASHEEEQAQPVVSDERVEMDLEQAAEAALPEEPLRVDSVDETETAEQIMSRRKVKAKRRTIHPEAVLNADQPTQSIEPAATSTEEPAAPAAPAAPAIPVQPPPAIPQEQEHEATPAPPVPSTLPPAIPVEEPSEAAAVETGLSTPDAKRRATPTTSARKQIPAAATPLQSLVIEGEVVPLGEGWACETVARPSAKGKKDTYYYTPEGEKLRSKKKVQEYLELHPPKMPSAPAPPPPVSPIVPREHETIRMSTEVSAAEPLPDSPDTVAVSSPDEEEPFNLSRAKLDDMPDEWEPQQSPTRSSFSRSRRASEHSAEAESESEGEDNGSNAEMAGSAPESDAEPAVAQDTREDSVPEIEVEMDAEDIGDDSSEDEDREAPEEELDNEGDNSGAYGADAVEDNEGPSAEGDSDLEEEDTGMRDEEEPVVPVTPANKMTPRRKSIIRKLGNAFNSPITPKIRRLARLKPPSSPLFRFSPTAGSKKIRARKQETVWWDDSFFKLLAKRVGCKLPLSPEVDLRKLWQTLMDFTLTDCGQRRLSWERVIERARQRGMVGPGQSVTDLLRQWLPCYTNVIESPGKNCSFSDPLPLHLMAPEPVEDDSAEQ